MAASRPMFAVAVTLLAFGGAPLGAQDATPASGQARSDVEVVAATHHDTSPPLWQIPPAPRQAERENDRPKRLPRPRPVPGALAAEQVLQTEAPTANPPTILQDFDGVGQGFVGPAGTFTVNAAPPDTNGDVGPNHYVQIVNTDFAVFTKGGAPIFGPVPVNTLWSGFGGGCQSNNDGDPVVVYDPIADRWLISQFSVSTTPFLQCVAISQTADPTGAYFRYSFSYTAFNDYPKIGVWPDGYYATFNMFNASGTAFLGAKVCAYDRARMLAGLSATQQCFDTSTAFGGLLPADLDGSRLPPAGAPNPVVALGASPNQLAVWKFHVDWGSPGSSSFTGPTVLPTAAFTEACGGGTCIVQPGTSQRLDSLADRLMYRLAYRNFADGHQSLVVNHAITAGSGVGVRWYEIRIDGAGTPSLFQQGTYAPDSGFRWMGSIAQDQVGNMALGFSLSSSTVQPRVHFTGRLAGDAAGLMTQGEGAIIDPTGVQTGTRALSRWGDYSMMAVDPSDDCTFWYTQEYIPVNGIFNWRTRVGTFQLPGCGTLPDTPVITLKVNGQHPTPPVVTVDGPTLVTLDVSASSFSAAVDWYWAIVSNGSLFWVTSTGLSTVPAPLFHAPPVAVSNATLLNVTLPPASTLSNIFFMVNGTSLVASDFITATRP